VIRHGSESYFVLGEGLLGEALGGRRVAAVATAADAATAPPFRFSRMGPKGTGKQLGEANRTKIAEAMTVANLTASQVPAGFTYLGQFIDHDLTFDKSALMEGVDISPAELEQNRSPSLDLDSLYGARILARPSSTATACTSRWATPTEARPRRDSICHGGERERWRRNGRRSSRTRGTTRILRSPKSTWR
jgi:hypothetical protein